MSCLYICDSAKLRRKTGRSKEKERLERLLGKNGVSSEQKREERRKNRPFHREINVRFYSSRKRVFTENVKIRIA